MKSDCVKVSIIIPVYNTEKYLYTCLESICNQTFSDYEVILVDDGSTDNSPAICDEFCAKDERFRTFHQRNTGVSSARNLGLEQSSGEFVVFVDSDDVVAANYLAVLMTNLQEDLVMANYSSDSIAGTFPVEKPLDQGYYSIGYQGLSFLFSSHLINTIFAKRFRKTIIVSADIRFSETITLAEDTLFLVEYLKYCSGYMYIDTAIYYYRYDNIRQTLSSYDNSYISKLEYVNDHIRNMIEDVCPGITSDKSWLIRIWNIYYQAIFRVLNGEYGFREKMVFLKRIFQNKNYATLVQNVDYYMSSDGALLRYLIKRRNALALIVYWTYHNKLKKWF